MYMASGGKDRNIKVWKIIFFKDFKNGAMEKLQLETNIPDAHSMDITALRAS
jgi:hypothetical protein